jgi:phosphohistidine phosphatase
MIQSSAGKYLFILRHAKSSWDDSSIADHDRPLAPRGRRAAARIAEYAAERGIRPNLVLCSSASRARQTFERIATSLGRGAEVSIEQSLYGATGEQLVERLRAIPNVVRSVMLIGHNPGVQDLGLLLCRASPLRARLEAKFPTGALATLDMGRIGWKNLERGCGELADFVVPRRLG